MFSRASANVINTDFYHHYHLIGERGSAAISIAHFILNVFALKSLITNELAKV